MGGFLGIGTSAEERALRRQNALRRQEAERSRQEAEIRLAERKAKKGQETAKVKIGTEKKQLPEEELPKGKANDIAPALGLGSGERSKTGVQL